MIRKARPSDSLDLAALSLQVWLHMYATQGLRAKISHYALSTFTEHYFQQILNNSSCETLVYIKEDHLVGFIVIDTASYFNSENNGYEVTTLYVSEHFQGQGIGRQLRDQIKIRYGLPYWLSTWVNNHQAIKFYHKLGFKLIGELNFDLSGELHENHVFARTSTWQEL